ncbi:ferrous iron transporter B [Paenibacillus sp. IB182496]|uniref:Ferrous iron transporter B n=1 Tax=Paenibacillus sabuli TaxID=2772509 RepID=A0A927BRD5_9BACL|nr:nucleoside recognition domain-containing protein [Paenibacillus sabuli]MBD2845351.1 ferrous iron transporter B [Paenibacillus sabuli]
MLTSPPAGRTAGQSERAGSRTMMLVGFESAGKSALFRGLTGDRTGTVANFRGSTVQARRARLAAELELADLPGIRLSDDSETTRTALDAAAAADTVMLVVRATHAADELPRLLDAVPTGRRPAALVLTFADKLPSQIERLQHYYTDWLGIPVVTADARSVGPELRRALLRACTTAAPIRSGARHTLASDFPGLRPQTTWFEHARWGRPLALAATLLMFAGPVWLAYLLSNALQPVADRYLIEPLVQVLDGASPLAQALLVGDYGLLTLGWYSFLWAFPVVALLGLSVALTEESGLKDRITDALDGWMRRIGLSGRDLIPVLSGFGCNVVAVYQSRVCSACTRKSCVSLIAFGSACSYQIGASLSLFGSAGRPWLFVPYIGALVLVGALHTRLWQEKGQRTRNHAAPLHDTATFVQRPRLRASLWRLRATVRQFLLQAMPIFLGICVAAALLQQSGLLERIAGITGPLLQGFGLPAEAAPGVLFSVLRKDGLLVLNQGGGELVQAMTAGQIFVLVYLASTLTACLVTLWTVRKELGARYAAALAGKQALTSLGTAALMALAIGLLGGLT